MGRFTQARLNFNPPKPADDDGTGIPKPAIVKLSARRMAGIREASEILAHLPAPGESLHALCTARLDLTDVINALLERLGVCDVLHIATLGYNERNLRMMLGWLDSGAVKSLALVASKFFRGHKGDLWEETVHELGQHKQRCACVDSHAKVVTLAFASGERLVIHGSANLCGNGSGREQFALDNHEGLYAWHTAWIEELVSKHAAKASNTADSVARD